MPEILFRGKRKDNGEWVQGDLVRSYLKIGNACITDFAHGVVLGVDNSTVGQYTGLEDCKGTPVFEGDIVRLFNDVKRTFGISDGEVKWCRGAFVVGNGDSFRNSLSVVASYDWVLRGEVIGNIHDNPELLEEAAPC